MIEQDKKSIIGVAIGTILFMELLVFGGFGIAVPISVIIYYILIVWQSKMLKIKPNMKKNIFLIPIVLITLCFVFFDNGLLKFLNILFLYGLITLNTIEQFGMNRFEPLSFKWFLQLFPIGIVMPLENIMQPSKIVKAGMKGSSKESLTSGLKVLIGFLIGLPIVAMATILLMDSDIAFKSVIILVFKKFNFNIGFILSRIMLFIMIFFPLYGFLYGLRNKKNNVNGVEQKYKTKILDFTIVSTVTILLCTIYSIYCLSQLTYFISAFKGILPDGYSFSGYAREGFFECIPLGIINLLIIMVLTLFTKVEESKKKINSVKGYTYFIVAFTLFLVVSSFSKMCLYMSEYGITILRVYVSWFLIVGCITVLFIGIKTYNSKFKLTKSTFIVFTVMFLCLNYANIDYRIAQYDAKLYMTGEVNTIGAFEGLSDSALEPLTEISKNSNDEINYMIKKYEKRIYKERKWQEWNLTNYNAKKIFENNVK